MVDAGLRPTLADAISMLESRSIACAVIGGLAVCHSARSVGIGETWSPVVTVEDLLVMKALAGRPQDEQDIRGIVDLHGNRIDWTACLTTAKALGEAVDVDVVSRLEAARRHRKQD
jgi:predicted nucleotidyltransferase